MANGVANQDRWPDGRGFRQANYLVRTVASVVILPARRLVVAGRHTTMAGWQGTRLLRLRFARIGYAGRRAKNVRKDQTQR